VIGTEIYINKIKSYSSEKNSTRGRLGRNLRRLITYLLDIY
jgi:hypothetical protein